MFVIQYFKRVFHKLSAIQHRQLRFNCVIKDTFTLYDCNLSQLMGCTGLNESVHTVQLRQHHQLLFSPLQWRIQDFPEEGAPTPKVGAPTYYLVKNFPKTV